MTEKDHGTWTQYIPEEFPIYAPSGAAYCKRDSDGMDWYSYVHPRTNFEPDTVKHVLRKDADGNEFVLVSAVDPTMLFPAGSRLVEIMDTKRVQNEERLTEEFVNRVYDRKEGRVTEGKRKFFDPPPDPRVMKVLDTILEKLERLEKRSEGK